jgi:hypothetical protein
MTAYIAESVLFPLITTYYLRTFFLITLRQHKLCKGTLPSVTEITSNVSHTT